MSWALSNGGSKPPRQTGVWIQTLATILGVDNILHSDPRQLTPYNFDIAGLKGPSKVKCETPE